VLEVLKIRKKIKRKICAFYYYNALRFASYPQDSFSTVLTMSSSAFSAILQGLEPVVIEVEVDQTPGLPTLQIIGLATNAVSEAKERITTALATQQLVISTKRTVVNLAPTDLKKSSPGLDLAIIIALLKQNQHVTANLTKTLFLGEIALNGRLKAVSGTLPIIWKAKQLGFERAIIPYQNVQQVSAIKNVEVLGFSHLKQVLHYLQTGKKSKQYGVPIKPTSQSITSDKYSSILGQEIAKRALQIAASGNHNILFIGPPGSGKTKLAQSLLELLPELSEQEAIETTAIHSIGSSETALHTTRPFRSPHHTISDVGLLGGGTKLQPGEISLAHNGVLFLDELTEFNRRALEALRQPLVEKITTISRAKGNVSYPSNFCLVAACNPCPCGFYASTTKECRCPPSVRQRYVSKLSGPLLDRIELVVWVNPEQSILEKSNEHINLAALKDRIKQTRKQLSTKNTTEHISVVKKMLSPQAYLVLQQATTTQHLTTRAFVKAIQVAKTIHQLDQNTDKLLSKQEILEALQYRWKDTYLK